MRGQSSEFSEFIGARSSFSKKDALTPLAPSTSSPSSLPVRRWRLHLPTGSRSAKWQPPLRPTPPPLLAVGLAAGDSPLRVSRCKRLCPRVALLPAGTTPVGCCPCKRLHPLRAPLASLVGWPWPQLITPPCRGPWPGCGLSLLLAVFTAKMHQERVERFYAI
ncbi:hypothetical protein BHM03_00055720 [Ensete ventricosum]|nr:hypothetical protein BHM03_00055720 [Ensete ventricosum]